MSKITDIKKVSKLKHVSIHSEPEKEVHLSVHETQTNEPALDETADPLSAEVRQYLTKDYVPPKPTNEEVVEKEVEKTTSSDAAIAIEANDRSAVDPDTTSTRSFSEMKELLKKNDDAVRIVVMGTGIFAGEVIKTLVLNPAFNIVQIITQPDKKLGRKKSSIHRTLAQNLVRDVATTYGIVLYQPHKIDDETVATIESMSPDILIVASYGRILPQRILDIPRLGAINVHGSLLPLLRGASPIQNALMQGLTETGITIMQMDAGMDTGDILAQEKMPIKEHEKADELIMRLANIGGKLLSDTLIKVIKKEITPIPQDHTHATLCQLIDREDGHIQWTDTTAEIYNRFRALYPWPGIFGHWEIADGQLTRIKLRAIFPYNGELTDEQKELMPGTVFIGHDQLCIKTFDTAIIVEAIQPECKAVMPVYDFLNGHKEFEGAVLL